MQKYRVEFHCHTIFSKDSLTKPAQLISAARRAKLDRVIITDHNSINGALAARELDPELIIVGEEIMTTRGEILAAFVTEWIPAGLSPEEVIRRLREQGAFISVSHPFDTFRSGHWQQADLENITPLVDAIETFNSRCMDMRPNNQAKQFAADHGLHETVGSDAHVAFEVGRAALILEPFHDGDSLRQVIGSGIESVRMSSPLIHLTSRYASVIKKLGLVDTL